jgi:RimJ/RimL family protein N-acetyltransferase
MTDEHLEGLWTAGAHPELWRFMPNAIESQEEMRNMIADARQGSDLAFTMRVKPDGEIVGSTRYLNIEPAHKRLEIGYTWITPKRQRSVANTECKLLMLQHAFETLGCIRVEFKTDSLNRRSRTALARIGAVEEGTFRNHMIQPDGRLRHSVYFSIVDAEWPDVKARLQGFLDSHDDG